MTIEFKNPEQEKIYLEMTEHEHQREVFSWAAAVALYGIEQATLWASCHPQTLKRPASFFKACCPTEGDDRLKWLHAIPNGGSRGGNRAQRQREGARMKSEGVKAGIPDMFLPRPLGGSSGLYVELKRADSGSATAEQREFLLYAAKAGYRVSVCRGYVEVITTITNYLAEK